MKKTGKLSLKFTIGFIIIGLLICATSCTIGYIKYKGTIEKLYNDTAYNIAYQAVSFCNGDDIERYLATGETDDKYYETLKALETLRTNMGVNYVYVAEQVGLNFTYVLDADNPDDNLPPFALGDKGHLNPAFAEDAEKIVKTGERVDNYFYSHSQFGYNTSAIVPVYTSDGRIVAVLGVEIAMSKLQETLFQYVLYAVIISSALIVLFILCYMMYLHNKVVKPIKTITSESGRFIDADNNTTVSDNLLDIKTGDEIESLAISIHTMESEINDYIENITAITAEKERIGAELNVAKKIQSDMLPCIFPAFPERNEFDIFASMTPAKEVGGDFYDFFLVDNDHLALVIADVSGKGVPAALFMVIAKTLIKNSAQNGLSPKEVFEKVNNLLCENNEAGMFVTVWLGILEISTGIMKCANAGHEYPAIRRKDGSFELYKDKHGFVMAGMENLKYKEYELELHEGDKLFVYTDGVTEATDTGNNLFGTDRLLSSLNDNPNLSCEAIMRHLRESIDTFVGEAPQFDDITMLCLEINPTDSIKLVPDENSTQTAQAFLESEAEKYGLSPKIKIKLLTALDEIYSNIVRYSTAKSAKIIFTMSGGTVYLTFIDDGIPYNPLETPEPDTTLSAEDRKIGGLGIFMVKKSMDDMKYDNIDGNNILTLIKKL